MIVRGVLLIALLAGCKSDERPDATAQDDAEAARTRYSVGVRIISHGGTPSTPVLRLGEPRPIPRLANGAELVRVVSALRLDNGSIIVADGGRLGSGTTYEVLLMPPFESGKTPVLGLTQFTPQGMVATIRPLATGEYVIRRLRAC